MAEQIVDIESLVQDDLNFNKGTEQGRVLMDHSLKKFGAGRSILIDKNGRIIAGNKTALAAERAGIKKVRVVEVTGDELVAVRRTDIDLSSKEGREFALADNVTGMVNMDIDEDKVREAIERVNIRPDIWDLHLKETSEGGGLNRFAAEKNTTTSFASIKWGMYDIVLSPQENEELMRRAEEYIKANGQLEGFILHIIKEYNERKSKAND